MKPDALYPPESVSWSPERRRELLRSQRTLDDIAREAHRVLAVLRIPASPCPPACTRTAPPYCHCQACGVSGVHLDEGGYCAGCLGEKKFEP